MRWPLSVPVLSDGVVTLRAHSPEDIPLSLELAQDPDVLRHTGIPTPHTLEMAQEWILQVIPRDWDDGSARRWAIEVDGRYAGNIDIRGNGVADIGFVLLPWARGHGHMVRAVQLAIDWTFAEGVAEVVHWRAHVGNEGSLRVAHRAGFTLHGTTPGLLWERGRALDAWTGSIRFGDAPLPRTRWLDAALESDRLRLRAATEADVPRIVEACSDPRSQQWLPMLPAPYTVTHARAFVHSTTWRAATGAKASWIVTDRASDDLLATVAIMGLDGPDPGQGEIGYWAHPEARGRGIVTEAVTRVARFALAPLHEDGGLGLRRLSLYAAAGNAASNHVAEAVGFTRYGTQHAAEMLGDGSVDDLHGYELLA